MFVDLNCRGLTPGHGADGLVDHWKKGFASEFALERGNGSNLAAFHINGFERKHDTVIIVEPNFIALVGAVRDNSS